MSIGQVYLTKIREADILRDAYVTSVIYQFRIHDTGALAPLPTLVVKTRGLRDIVIDAQRPFVYVASDDVGAKGVIWSRFRILPSGRLRAATWQHTTKDPPDIHASKHFLYAVDASRSLLHISRRLPGDKAYTLQPQKLANVPRGFTLSDVIVEPSERYAYASYWEDDPDPIEGGPSGWAITSYRISQDGRLALAELKATTSIAQPIMHADSLGRFIYVTSTTKGRFYVFRILPDGRLFQTESLDLKGYPSSFATACIAKR